MYSAKAYINYQLGRELAASPAYHLSRRDKAGHAMAFYRRARGAKRKPL
jgi:hypothetical protein